MAAQEIIINRETYKLIPYGCCGCGCGEKTRISARTHTCYGHVKGQPIKYIMGHQNKGRNGKSSASWRGGKTITKDGYIRIYNPGHPRAINGYVLEHVLVAEKALGKALPPKAMVHHIDGNRQNNKPSNLVICESNKYHRWIHQRMRALKACGHANWRSCKYCKKYDDPKNMFVKDNQAYHKLCSNEYQRNNS